MFVEGSVVAAAGMALMEVEALPEETTRHFECDATTGQMLWFPGPPMDVARPPPPRHRLQYLHFLAKKYGPELELNTSEAKISSANGINLTTNDDAKETVANATVQQAAGEEYISASERLREICVRLNHS
ncbi:hypothetical protein B0H16DRAFT_880062 [Mycena metata]|uniref:Uncharacterized protein n=1 Tax=Mycena metata TaxID=1033252 RepID=A0AAD7K742_9AGAR|nr:hypothetical protein B0H16DRAFT_880062 [Mycena metata]